MLMGCAVFDLCNHFVGYFAQGLDDHSHKPTLERLPKDKLVVGSPAAAAVCQSLGFTNVFGLDHSKTKTVCNGRLQITATAGEHAVATSGCHYSSISMGKPWAAYMPMSVCCDVKASACTSVHLS